MLFIGFLLAVLGGVAVYAGVKGLSVTDLLHGKLSRTP